VLNKTINDENYNDHLSLIDDHGSGSSSSSSVSGTNQTKAKKVQSAGQKSHFGVLSSVGNLSPKKSQRLMDCFEYKYKPIGSLSLDDGFSQLRAGSAEYVDSSHIDLGSPKAATRRHIPSGPSKILDAPDLMDDYYLNLLHWGQNNVIAVALNSAVYLWHADDGRIDNLVNLEGPDSYVTSVQWAAQDNTLAVGTNNNTVELWDAAALRKVRELPGHSSRVSSLSWNGSHMPNLLSSGARDSLVLHHDVRAQRNVTAKCVGHTQEICGLAWSPDGLTLASGGNENRLCIWDVSMSGQYPSGRTQPQSATAPVTPRCIIEDHNAAVKAVSWCPWQRNILASGGGKLPGKRRMALLKSF